jgi:hypothetical protein
LQGPAAEAHTAQVQVHCTTTTFEHSAKSKNKKDVFEDGSGKRGYLGQECVGPSYEGLVQLAAHATPQRVQAATHIFTNFVCN